MKSNSKTFLLKMMQLALLTAIVFLFQTLGQFIHIGPTSVSLVLIPIVLGSILVGPAGGAFLGLVFGLMTLWAGVSGTDGFTNILFTTQPIATSLICIGKGVFAGLGAGLVYKAVYKKNHTVASFLAAAAAPIINTGLFIIGGLTLVAETLTTNFVSGTTLIYFLVIGCAGFNFIAEFILNIIVAPAIDTTVKAITKNFERR